MYIGVLFQNPASIPYSGGSLTVRAYCLIVSLEKLLVRMLPSAPIDLKPAQDLAPVFTGGLPCGGGGKPPGGLEDTR